VSVLDHALAYAHHGYDVLPLYGINALGQCVCGRKNCLSPGKHPAVQHGAKDASSDSSVITEWFSDGASLNVGLWMGDEFLTIDGDPRNGSAATLERIEACHEELPYTVNAISGGGGPHWLYRIPESARGAPMVKTLGPGVDVITGNRYIVVEPSLHASGKRYQWKDEGPHEGAAPTEVPQWLLRLLQQSAPALLVDASTPTLSKQRCQEIASALAIIPADCNRDLWVRIGMALHHESDGSRQGFALFHDWSSTGGDKYKGLSDCWPRWQSFAGAKQSVTIQTVFKLAYEAGWPGFTAVDNDVVIDFDALNKPGPSTSISMPAPYVPAQSSVPEGLLVPPGLLAEITQYINRVSSKPQPAFATSTALALGSIAMGRRYMTAKRNHTGLYILHVGVAGCGKEDVKRIMLRFLRPANLERLLVGSGYTSKGAIFTALEEQPAHLAIVDEFGDFLEACRDTGQSHLRMSVATLKEAFSSDTTVYPQVYSRQQDKGNDRAKNNNQSGNVGQNGIINPSITLIGMTTPKSFYANLTDRQIEGGFMSRMLVIQSDTGHQIYADPELEGPPKYLVERIEQLYFKVPTEGIPLPALDLPGTLGTEHTIGISNAALECFRIFDQDIVTQQQSLYEDGLDPLLVRSREKAMRIAAICAGFKSQDELDAAWAPTIEQTEAEWAIDWVRYWDLRMVESMRDYMIRSEYQELYERMLDAIRKAGPRGLTDYGLKHKLRSIPIDTQAKLVKHLSGARKISQINIKTRGRTRVAWVAIA
jgi:hypothetical protein